jgi:hypothetical protein
MTASPAARVAAACADRTGLARRQSAGFGRPETVSGAQENILYTNSNRDKIFPIQNISWAPESRAQARQPERRARARGGEKANALQ